MISLINLFNKYARDAFRLPGSALGSKDKAVGVIPSGTHENTGCEIWVDGCWVGEPQGDRRTPTRAPNSDLGVQGSIPKGSDG